MTSLKKSIFIILSVIVSITFAVSRENKLYISSSAAIGNSVKVAVLLFDFNDPYKSLIRNSLENIQTENPNKVSFTFFDSKSNQATQNEILDNLVNNNFDLLLVNLIDTSEGVIEDIINKVKPKNIPLILFDAVPSKTNPIRSYNKAFFIGTLGKQSGILQGKILADLWSNNKEIIDKNKDNIMQYIMLQGRINNQTAIDRTQYSVSTINDAGIATQQLVLKVCNWDEECAKNSIEALFFNYGPKIEAIIANNDAMAIGAIKTLQKYGYNKGDKTKTIPVVGVDAIPEAQELIKQGFMAGTVVQDYEATAKALYTVGMNLVSNRDPLENTEYKFEEPGVIILPYLEYTQ